jgi:hypothetical protein
MGCNRWVEGCDTSRSDHLATHQRDATAYNWLRKRRLFEDSRFWVAAPSEWLMSKVNRSI